MTDEQPPERRLRLDLTVHADDLPELVTVLENVAIELSRDVREDRSSWSVGYRSSHELELRVTDDAMDGDRYRAQLRDWWKRRKEARSA